MSKSHPSKTQSLKFKLMYSRCRPTGSGSSRSVGSLASSRSTSQTASASGVIRWRIRRKDFAQRHLVSLRHYRAEGELSREPLNSAFSTAGYGAKPRPWDMAKALGGSIVIKSAEIKAIEAAARSSGAAAVNSLADIGDVVRRVARPDRNWNWELPSIEPAPSRAWTSAGTSRRRPGRMAPLGRPRASRQHHARGAPAQMPGAQPRRERLADRMFVAEAEVARPALCDERGLRRMDRRRASRRGDEPCTRIAQSLSVWMLPS